MYPHDNVRLESFLLNVCQIKQNQSCFEMFYNSTRSSLACFGVKLAIFPFSPEVRVFSLNGTIKRKWQRRQNPCSGDCITNHQWRHYQSSALQVTWASEVQADRAVIHLVWKKIHKQSSWFVVCLWHKDTWTDRFVTHIISMIGYSPVQSTWKGWF